MKVIIMGCGRVGAELARELEAESHQVTILDSDPDSFERLPPDFKGEALLGDATDSETLVKAGIAEADAFVTLTEHDNRNILAAQKAKHIYSVPRVLCRIYDPDLSEMFDGLGLEVFSPTRIVAQLLKRKLAG